MISPVTLQYIRQRLGAANYRRLTTTPRQDYPSTWTDDDVYFVDGAYDDVAELLREVERLQKVVSRLYGHS